MSPGISLVLFLSAGILCAGATAPNYPFDLEQEEHP